MKLVQKLLNKIDGLHYNQEYLCLTNETFQQPLHVYLLNEHRVIKDITNLHCFVGYCPVVFALPASLVNFKESNFISIALTQKTLSPNEEVTERDAIAMLSMEKIQELPMTSERIFFYEGKKAQHRFISIFNQKIIELNNRLYQKKPGNVFLEGNLYKQVQVAYAVPRNISLVTVGKDSQYNLFPTDLHGPINDHYIISLRYKGKACQQVMDSKKLLLSQVESGSYKSVYALGKNHMQPLKGKEAFRFSSNVSDKLQLPLPEQTTLYRELELQDSFIAGIHRIMLFKTLHKQAICSVPATLAHIHNAYATWRHKIGLPGNYLLR
jgi:hypothetical protein